MSQWMDREWICRGLTLTAFSLWFSPQTHLNWKTAFVWHYVGTILTVAKSFVSSTTVYHFFLHLIPQRWALICTALIFNLQIWSSRGYNYEICITICQLMSVCTVCKWSFGLFPVTCTRISLRQRRIKVSDWNVMEMKEAEKIIGFFAGRKEKTRKSHTLYNGSIVADTENPPNTRFNVVWLLKKALTNISEGYWMTRSIHE